MVSVELILAILVSSLLILLILRRGTPKILLALTTVVVIASWLFVAVGWVTDRWTPRLSFTLPDLRFIAVGAILSGILILLGNMLNKKAGQSLTIVLAAIWLAAGMGWWAGEWSGILAITMPSLMILIVGLLALPPFVLPVPPLPWKWTTVGALLYAFVWLVCVWTDWVEMDIMAFWVYLQGFLLIFRPAFPIGNIRGFIPLGLFAVYGLLALTIWRGFGGFDLSTRNLLVLTQGLLTLSCYVLPVIGQTASWALGLSVFYGLGYISVMALGRIEASLSNFFILFLGVAAIERFLVAERQDVDRQISSVTIWSVTYSVTILRATLWALFALYALIWFIGVITGDLDADGFGLLTFVIGSGAIFLPGSIRASDNWRAFKALITFNLGTNYPFQAVKGRKLVTRAAGNPFSQLLAGPGIILSDADHAIVIYRGGVFGRVAPPGVTFTDPFEFVNEIVDLRPQFRSTPPVTVTTKDGIEVSVVTFTPVRVAADRRAPELGDSFPYDAEAIRKAVHAQLVAQGNDEKQGWDNLVRQACEQVMRDIVAEKTLDELCGLLPRIEIAAQMRNGVRQQIQQKDWGLELIAGGIGDFTPPDEVIRQRIEHWKARWESKIVSLEAEAEAEERRMIERARAAAQKELLVRITQGLEPLATPGSAKRERLMVTVISLLEALEREGASDPALALQAVPQIRATQQWLMGQESAGKSRSGET